MEASVELLLLQRSERNEIGRACSAYWETRGVYRDLWGNLKERDHLGDPGIDGKIIIIRWTFRTWEVGLWTRLI